MTYKVIKDIKTSNQDIIIRADQSFSLEFSGEGIDLNNHHRLYFTCEDRMSSIFKDEPFGDKLYMLIEDSLDTEHALLDRYCLNMSEKTARPFMRCAAVKRVWAGEPKNGLYGFKKAITDKWNFGIFAKATDLKINEGGFLRFRFESWDIKDGVDPNLTGAAPDHTEFVDICEGSYDYTEFCREITIDCDNTACVMVTIEGKNYSGEVYLERPSLTASNGDNVIPHFDVAVPCTHEPYREHNWLGMSMSKKEWPRFRITLNGEVFFDDETFLRIHRYSPVEIEIPDGLVKDNNILEVTYTSDYHDTVPLAFNEIKILEKPKAPIHVHYCPPAVIGKDIRLLIETEKDNTTVTVKSDRLSIKGENSFEKKGLHPLTLTGENYQNNMQFTLACDGYELEHTIERAIARPEDNVTIGSGDLIYIDNSNLQAVCDYIEWALENKTHNLITIRPAYRWGGQRTINPEVWQKFCELCNALEINYVHMTDGRDLPGIACNPAPDMLKGERFLGIQQHERDGHAFYWGYMPQTSYAVSNAFFDLTARLFRETPETMYYHAGGHMQAYDKKYYLAKNVGFRPDMKDAHTNSIATLKNIKYLDTRHTGPSVMFKYFYQAGWDWAGAETMDSATETMLAFMRGAAKAYGKNRTGVHHAVQWSTRPHDTEERYRRFMLANYVSYLQGATEINTEEGLWFLECQYTYHNRFSPACVNHSAMQRKLYEFITTHSRTGRYYTPTAFIHGRYDGWYGFGSSKLLFGQDNLRRGEPENSWELLNVFYPNCAINKGGVTGYYPEGHGKPIGLVSGTPNGNVDVVPIEVSDFSEYRLACFTSYNCAEDGDMERLLSFVKNGGTLLACWPHFSTVTYRPDIEAGRFEIINSELTYALTKGKAKFVDGACVNFVDSAEVLKTDEKGRALVVKIKIGNGQVVLVNRLKFPANPEISELYKNLIIELNAAECKKDFCDVICNDDVQFVKYVQNDGSMHVYITPVDWYRDPTPERKATLRVGDNLYPLSLKFGDITKIVVKNGVAVWPENTDAEILSVEPLTVQGSGKTAVFIAKDGKIIKKETDVKDGYFAVIE